MPRSKQLNTPASKQEISTAAIAWAEFLYDEFMLAKHKQLLLNKQDKKIVGAKQGGGSK